MDGYGAANYWQRDSEGHLTLTPVEGKLRQKLQHGVAVMWKLVPVDTDYDHRWLAFNVYEHTVPRNDYSSSHLSAASNASWVPLLIQQVDAVAF